MSEPYRSSARFVLETEDWPSKDPLGEIDVAYHARALDDKVAEIYRFYIVPASNIRRSGMSRADSTNVCYHPSFGRPKSVPDTVFPRVRRPIEAAAGRVPGVVSLPGAICGMADVHSERSDDLGESPSRFSARRS